MSPGASMPPGSSKPIVSWGVCGQSIPGETESGDLHVVAHFTDGVLVAVIDGLGHGPGAASAARAAAHVLEEFADEPVMPLVRRCHEALRGTRGVVLSVAAFSAGDNTMTWLGVGNVEGVLFRADTATVPRREGLLLRGGVVGYQLPPLRPTTLPVVLGDMLVFATDGIRSHFADESPIGCDPDPAAQSIHAHFGKVTDDSLVLVARYEGRPS